jgi:hypothetical protein
VFSRTLGARNPARLFVLTAVPPIPLGGIHTPELAVTETLVVIEAAGPQSSSNAVTHVEILPDVPHIVEIVTHEHRDWQRAFRRS